MADLALDLRGVGRAYGDLWALDDVHLAVPRGQVVVIFGHNGSGKTTLLRVAAGRLEPTVGSVRVLGRRLATDDGRQVARRRLGYVLDDPVFYPDLTVDEHLGLVAVAYDVADADARIAALLDRLGLDHRAAVLPDHLSSGMRQKLQLACVLLREPEVLLLDEPTRGLDPRTRDLLWELLAERRAAGATVMLTTHHADLPSGFADGGAVLADGLLVASGSYAEVVASEPAQELGLS